MKRQIFRSAIVTGLVLALASTGRAQTNPAASAGSVHELMHQALADKPGTEVAVITVEYPPGGVTPPHEHPGHTYAYVLEGAVVSQLDDQPPQTYKTGQMWSEEPHQHHMVSKNASATAPAKLLVFFVVPPGEKLTQFLPTK